MATTIRPGSLLTILALLTAGIVAVVVFSDRTEDSVTEDTVAEIAIQDAAEAEPVEAEPEAEPEPDYGFTHPYLETQTPTATESGDLMTWEFISGDTITKSRGSVATEGGSSTTELTVSGYPATRTAVVSQRDGSTSETLTIVTPDATYTLHGSTEFIELSSTEFVIE